MPRLRFVLLCVLLLVPTALRADPPFITTPVVLNPQCPDPCPVRELKSGRFDVKSAGFPSGVAFRLMLRGLELEGAPGIPGTSSVRVAVALSFHGMGCQTYESPTFSVTRGRLDARFARSDLTPAVPFMLGVVELCGVSVVVPASDAFAVGGLVMG